MNLKTHLALFESAVAAVKTTFQGNPIDCEAALKEVEYYIDIAGIRRVMVIGNGGSAAIASHVTNDLIRTGIPAVPMFEPAVLTCLANDFAYWEIFRQQVKFHGRPNDVLIAISSSGESQNIWCAMDAALELNMNVIGFSGFSPDSTMLKRKCLAFYVPSHDYGIVEVAHQLILHHITDRLRARYALAKMPAE